jgi:DNA-binding NarL/FixJ family response regulator
MTLQAAPARAVNQEVSSHQPTHTATILLAEDFAKWRFCVRSILRSQPHWKIVSEACDGNEAVQKAAELQPDLIILDIGLPHMNGIRAATLIRQRSPHSRIVFLSQSTNLEIRQAALAVGQAVYVAKANAATELLDTIAAVLAGRFTSA